MLVASNYKEIAFQLNQKFEKEDHLITIVGSIGSLANGLSRSIWGILFDKFSFKSISILINAMLLCACATIMFAASRVETYSILVTLAYFCYGGSFAIFPTQTVRVFGEENGSKIFFLVFIGASLASILQFSLHYFIVEQFENHIDGYFYCFLVFAGVQACGLLMSIFINYQYTCLEENLFAVKDNTKYEDAASGTESSKEITYISENKEPFIK